jgi:hypothetical protein
MTSFKLLERILTKGICKLTTDRRIACPGADSDTNVLNVIRTHCRCTQPPSNEKISKGLIVAVKGNRKRVVTQTKFSWSYTNSLVTPTEINHQVFITEISCCGISTSRGRMVSPLCRSLTLTGSNLNMDTVFLKLGFSHCPQSIQ